AVPTRRVAVVLLAVAFAALLACRVPYGMAPPPTGPQQPAGEPNRPAGSFDPEDPEATLQWIVGQTQEIAGRDNHGDLLANKTTEEALGDFYASLKGRKIRWPLRVSEVRRDATVWLDGAGWNLSEGEAPKKLRYVDAKTAYHFGFFTAPPKGPHDAAGGVFASEKIDWLKPLKKGDVIILPGTIAAVRLYNATKLPLDAPHLGHFHAVTDWEVAVTDYAIGPHNQP